jgi:hypothetical protein
MGNRTRHGRYAVVTPYFMEQPKLLRRCIDSVKAQSVETDHFVVADGRPQSWIDQEAVRHIKLDRAHGDYGNTPRGMGAMIALAEAYDGMGFLDADNWLERDHVGTCLEAASDSPGGAAQCDYVIARRMFRRPDATLMPVEEEFGHVDTSCFFFLRGAFSFVPHWMLMPKEISVYGDRIFYQMLRQHDLQCAVARKPTVNYLCLWESVYRQLEEVPPEEAKPNLDQGKVYAWLNSLDERQFEIVNRLCGVRLTTLREEARQALAIAGGV